MSKKVLVVDDDAKVVKFLKSCLETAAYEVITASDGEEALKKARAEHPDLVIVDLVLPKMTGWNMGYKLNCNEQQRRVPIIVLSGLLDGDSGGDGEEVGDFHMAKPVDPEKLLAKAKELLQKNVTP